MSQEIYFNNINDLDSGIKRVLGDGISTRIFCGDQSMLSIVTIEPNAKGQIHSHPQEQWGFLIEGSGIRIQGGEEVVIKKGDFWQTPGGIDHGIIGGPEGAKVLDIFSPPRDEYKKSGSGFGD
ncbi:cupin domain-containing protein [Alphaproteobacteria bacterium]|jgi:quercetin dioxygenase-like cupin family protein|nr:cupin domain-containing protein [Alphaproteobacteria bacterium]MDC6451577.1 cupin domain-containing protein [Alphaproteobacteria bacterium]|tara:strand:+ start:6390 stop:6758 length:369 start_codon:yes stop_codon:yes gene_type:complete